MRVADGEYTETCGSARAKGASVAHSRARVNVPDIDETGSQLEDIHKRIWDKVCGVQAVKG
ncbi:hypothetical protein GCM10010520_54540 [Rhizobium viscosum]